MSAVWCKVLLGCVLLAGGCVGGPVSDLPHSGAGETPIGPPRVTEDDDTGSLDAGSLEELDAGIPDAADTADAGDAGDASDAGS